MGMIFNPPSPSELTFRSSRKLRIKITINVSGCLVFAKYENLLRCRQPGFPRQLLLMRNGFHHAIHNKRSDRFGFEISRVEFRRTRFNPASLVR